jgi:hypothetical protein
MEAAAAWVFKKVDSRSLIKHANKKSKKIRKTLPTRSVNLT